MAAVGSSKNTTGVRCASTRDMAMRALSPPESVSESRACRWVMLVAWRAASTIKESCSAETLPAQGRRPISTTSRTRKLKATLVSCSITERRRESSLAEAAETSVEPRWAAPLESFRSPERAERNVDLPAPLGPISAVISPGRAVMLTFARMGLSAIVTLMFSARTSIISGLLASSFGAAR